MVYQAEKDGPVRRCVNLPPIGWGYMIILAAFLTRVIVYGILSTTGILFVVFVEVFEGSKAYTALIGSVLIACANATAPVSSAFVNRFGCGSAVIAGGCLSGLGLVLTYFADSVHFLIISYGIVTGSGIGFVFVPLTIIVSDYFPDARTIAMGLSSCGGGVGQLLFPIIFSQLRGAYGWRGAVLLCGGVAFHTCLCGAIMRPNVQSNRSVQTFAEPRAKKIFDVRIFCNSYYVIFCASLTCYAFSASIIYVHLASFAKTELGVHEDVSSILYSIIGVTSMLGKAIFGLIAHHPRVSPYALYILSKALLGFATYFLVAKEVTFPWLCVYALIYGIADSVFGGALLPEMLVDIAGLNSLSESYGTLMLVSSVGQLSGAPTAGYLHDSLGSYDVAIVLAASLVLLNVSIVTIIWRCKPRTNDEESQHLFDQSLQDINAKYTNEN